MMKKRSRLRKRIREWLSRRKERKEEKTLPSFGGSSLNREQGKVERTKEIYQNKKPTVE
jgi:hypothetical protein